MSSAPCNAARIVVVSNRLPDPAKPAAGGLAVALGEMSQEAKVLWFGWSGQTHDEPSPCVRSQQFGRTTFAQIDLSRWQHDNYYAGFANSVLWPVFHEKMEYADPKPEFSQAYEQVNKMFAAQLAPLLKNDDVLWIHDYHLIPLAEELRALGCRQRMGFFNHIPLPPPAVIKEIPRHQQLMKSLFSYDLVGMQSEKDVQNLRQYVTAESVGDAIEGPCAESFSRSSPSRYMAVQSLDTAPDGSQVKSFGRSTSFKEFPIGIDVGKLNALVPTPKSKEVLDKVRSEAGRRRLMIGVDRLDYSKGIPTRLEAFSELLDKNPQMRGEVTFVQVAAPTRDSVEAYRDLSKKTRALVDRINSEFGTDTWQPVLYFNHSVEREALPEIYRMGPVGVVTPSADGMNLVAKEYVAAQPPENPGVLVLSERAGAASQLSASVMVQPHDRHAIANAYKRALTMPLDERQRRHSMLLKNVATEDLAWWRQRYLDALQSLPASSDEWSEKAAASAASSPHPEPAADDFRRSDTVP
ncbi:trehalose 6-phosphate synthase [Xylophilus ampelinus]|uniref:Trehalose 6-phosphate synthase n=2 Tax=Xylophilus ampelinus TaxID=54067 RepID=A0A318SKE2_9BURK|nr:trehalose 6-phosphate synthase [Xylophilus ampelinus]